MEQKDLTPEQRAKFDACTTPEEVFALVKEEGLELSEAQLDQIAGGWGESSLKCPNCGCTEFTTDHTSTANMMYVCKRCGTRW